MAIPLVAASEKGLVQTIQLEACWRWLYGVEGLYWAMQQNRQGKILSIGEYTGKYYRRG